ncbi:hypothetical protein BaRGS_00023701 [Batillaria attramentaria]|uniref:Cathepsin L n=1 Tax=Batillaria attramentaria TaxID=370345 RepID=A0ABD0KDR9_9CAEN
MLRAIVALSAVALCLGSPLDSEWEQYKSQYNRRYTGLDEAVRKAVFAGNLAYIQRHNAEADTGLHTFWLGIGPFTDMYNASATYSGEVYVPTIPDGREPAKVDWRKKGYVTPVKNQGQCGSCWAFSTTGSLEGQHFKKTQKLVSLSEQNLVDCSKKEGNLGCMGGLMDQAFKYIKKNGGIDTEASYPYRAHNEKCSFKKQDVGATLKSWKDIEKGNEKALEKAVAEIGPISVAIDAGHESFQHYKKGVYNEPKCSSKKLDHGVLAVGYGVEEQKDYWIVKNSWGPEWGEKGYILMSRNKNNQCGIATQASYPIV